MYQRVFLGKSVNILKSSAASSARRLLATYTPQPVVYVSLPISTHATPSRVHMTSSTHVLQSILVYAVAASVQLPLSQVPMFEASCQRQMYTPWRHVRTFLRFPGILMTGICSTTRSCRQMQMGCWKTSTGAVVGSWPAGMWSRIEEKVGMDLTQLGQSLSGLVYGRHLC